MESGNRTRDTFTAVAVFCATLVLVWFGNGLTPWWPLMWFAPLPLFWFSLRARWWSAALMAACAWLAGSVSLLGYFLSLGTPFSVWLADFGGIASIVATGVLLFRALVLRGAVWTGMVALAALWVSIDWLRYWVTPHGTAADLAYTQLEFLPFLQLACVTGPWGMTFLLLLVPAATAVVLYLRERDPRSARRVACVVAGLMLAVLGFGALRLNEPGQRQIVKVGLVASDSPENDIADAGANAERLLSAYAAQARILASHGAQVIVMPEKIAVVRDKDTSIGNAVFQPLADAAGVTIVAGQLHVSSDAKGTLKYNRADVYEPHAAVASYDKQHMLPPFESSLTPGTAKLTISGGGSPWGIAICKDMDFTSMSLGYGRLDAGLMLVPAWDFNVDRTWHGHMAIMRGVEGGFSVARAAKNGYLTLSDARGRVVSQTRSDSAPFATLLAEVPVGHVTTLFQRWGDWFAWVAVGLFGIVIVRLVGLQVSTETRPAHLETIP
jgi:apolipoprotein N-acyltransferase